MNYWEFIKQIYRLKPPCSRQTQRFVGFATRPDTRGTNSMQVEDLDIGDVVYAAHTLINDGSMPEADEGEVLAAAGTRGVIVMKGYLEENPQRRVFLVRFEDVALNLGRPVGCWVEDLRAE
jgi:nitrogen fixation protein NifZ